MAKRPKQILSYVLCIQCKRRGCAWNSSATINLFMPQIFGSEEEAFANFNLAGSFELAEKHLGAEAKNYKMSAAAELTRNVKRWRKYGRAR